MWVDVRGCTGTNGSATADIYLEFDNNADRYFFVFAADLYINGEESSKDAHHELGQIAKGPQTVMAGTINWPCGAELEVKNITVMWQTNNGGCGYTCDDYNAPSKCYQPTFELSTIPRVIGVAQSSDHPCPGEDVLVTAHVSDADGTVISGNWTYGLTTLPMALTSGTSKDGYWTATIPGQLEDTELIVFVTAEDNDGNIVSTDETHRKRWSEPDCTITVDDTTCSYSEDNTASVPNAGTGASYNWTLAGGTITGGQNTRSITWSAGAAGTATINVTVTGAYGCECSSSANVTIDDNPTVNITPDGGELTCATTFIILTANTTGSLCSVTSYQWYKDGGKLTGKTDSMLNVTDPGTYKVEVECANKCTANDTATVNKHISVPSVNAGPDKELTCNVTSVLLDATVTGGTGPFTYSWTNSTDDVVGTTEDITVSSPDTYTLTVTGANGCSDSDSAVVTQDINPPSVNAGPDKELTCNVTSVLLDATVTGGTGPFTYSWTNSTDDVVGTTEDITVSSPDTYTLTVTGANGCSDSDS